MVTTNGIGPHECQHCDYPNTAKKPVFRYVEKLPDDSSEDQVLSRKNGNLYGRHFWLHEECKDKKSGNFILFKDAYREDRKAFAS